METLFKHIQDAPYYCETGGAATGTTYSKAVLVTPLVGATSKYNSKKKEEFCISPLLAHHETVIVTSGCTWYFLLVNVPCHNRIESTSLLLITLTNGILN
jgi:hypothetical protein